MNPPPLLARLLLTRIENEEREEEKKALDFLRIFFTNLIKKDP